MISLCELNLSELRALLVEWKEPSFRAQQIFDWVYKKGVTSFAQMDNLGKKCQAVLSEKLAFPVIKLVETQEAGEVVKFLWELADGHRVESVLICSFARRTVCLSSQVGCAARCSFCASGKKGLIRDLTTAEIVEQILHIENFLRQKGERVCHLVYMGMGEPLDNYDAVMRSVRLANDPLVFGISQRRITISTVGVIGAIHRLAKEDLAVQLALSLHAPNQHLRQKIIPTARKYPLEEILEATRAYSQATGRDLTYEYILLAGMNDEPEHAEELADILRYHRCTVNLIPYNPIDGIRFERPSSSRVARFRSILEDRGIRTTQRYTKGDEIAAACGQLALRESPASVSLIG